MKLFLILFSFLSLHAYADDELELTTKRGAKIQVSVSVPEIRSGKLPALVLASGQGYHKDLPLLKGLAARASARGLVVYRFNYAYFTSMPRGEPSSDLSAEADDMRTVIEAAKKDERVDPARIIVGGKSLGTLVSYPLFRGDASLRALVLLTPICTDPDANGKAVGTESYPALASETRPIHFTLGNADPLCKLPALYDFLKTTTGNASVDVFGGGHSLTFGTPGDPANAARDVHNIDAAVSATAQWLDILLGKE